MTANDIASFEAALTRYGWFQECLLKDVRWDQFGTTTHLDFDYIWGEGGPAKGHVLSEPRSITLSLQGVQELIIRNALTDAMLADPERLDWGISEIARVRLQPASAQGVSGQPQDGPYHLVVEWESERRVDATFFEMRIGEAAQSGA